MQKRIKRKELVDQLRAYDKGRKSHWENQVIDDAFSLLFETDRPSFTSLEELKEDILNGAKDWKQYSWGSSGIALCSNYDVAKRYCTPKEFEKKREGQLPPNKREQWLDIQTRAFEQAWEYIELCWELEKKRGQK